LRLLGRIRYWLETWYNIFI